jgi:sec-independent protein translocase protein TatB
VVIGLLVVGPKDLPGLVRSVGRWTGKARKYSRDFTRNFEEMADQNELTQLRKELEEANRELSAAGRLDLDASGAETKTNGGGKSEEDRTESSDKTSEPEAEPKIASPAVERPKESKPEPAASPPES